VTCSLQVFQSRNPALSDGIHLQPAFFILERIVIDVERADIAEKAVILDLPGRDLGRVVVIARQQTDCLSTPELVIMKISAWRRPFVPARSISTT
jgi:hypothetical protein